MMKKLLATISVLIALSTLQAQCPTGEAEVTIQVSTDNYGYESYWELVPNGNNCGQATIFAGGNATQVGCGGAGEQDASAGNGYGNNATITEGPWCLTLGTQYDIKMIDDYGDGGTAFKVFVNGFLTAEFTSTNASATFTVQEPTMLDLETHHNLVYDYTVKGDVIIQAEFVNKGQTTISSFDFNYSIDDGTTVTQNITSANISFGEEKTFSHNTPWNPSLNDTYSVDIWVSNVNGNATDNNTSNDHKVKNVKVSSPIPNILDSYITEDYTNQEIVSSADQIDHPRDLDFHPNLAKKELWIVNKGTENSGSTNVKITNAGENNQTSEFLKDGNSWHFMSLTTALAFGENGNWATSPGVKDANHNGGTFTGPSLWSSDPNIFAVIGNPSSAQYNGSHLDMLHGSPYSMGIAHLIDNTYFVYDSYNKDIVKYNFNSDHGPGQSEHDNGEVWRYTELNVERDGDEIPNHMIIQKKTGQMYIADHKNSKIIRMDVNSGSVTNPNLPLLNETLATHAEVTGVDFNKNYISSGLNTPCGIDVIEDRLIVGDYSNGNILLYDISGNTPILLTTIKTNVLGLMGIKIGPEGRIWYVDAVGNTVNKLNVEAVIPEVGIKENYLEQAINVYPVPSSDYVTIEIEKTLKRNVSLQIYDLNGKNIASYHTIPSDKLTIDISNFTKGNYYIKLVSGKEVAIKHIIKK